MKTEASGNKNPYYILGVPSFANARQIRSAYVKRVRVLQPYRFDKGTQPVEWQIVNDVLRELDEAYAQVRSSDHHGNNPFETPGAPQGKPMPAKTDDHGRTPVNAGNRCYIGAGIGARYVMKSKPLILCSMHGTTEMSHATQSVP